MGRLIDTSDLHNKVMLNKSDWGIFATQIDNLIEGVVMQVSTAEAIPKADYETRLKSDMVAMLEEIQSKIREYHEIGCDEDCNNCRMVGCVEPVNVIKDLDIIQQKIDALKGGEDEMP